MVILSRSAQRLLTEVLALPTAPFAEGHVLRYIRGFLKGRRSCRLSVDRAGNLLAAYRRGPSRVARPVCLTAHTDHPGFVADHMLDGATLSAVWHGGVLPDYFPGARVRFYSRDRWVRGRVVSTTLAEKRGRVLVDAAAIRVAEPVATGSPGMWDFPDPRIRGRRIHARACDDLAGVAGLLACLDELDRRRAAGQAYFLFTRAEEVGFIGAMAACRLKTIPKRCVVVAVETSSQRPDALLGSGPILRVGDKATTFTSAATGFCGAVAADLAGTGNGFSYQRKLMDGGTCESSAFCALGYEATGVCVALGNYHNMDTQAKKLAPEYIDLGDFARLVAWFVALVRTQRRYDGKDAPLNRMLTTLRRDYDPLLRRPMATGAKTRRPDGHFILSVDAVAGGAGSL